MPWPAKTAHPERRMGGGSSHHEQRMGLLRPIIAEERNAQGSKEFFIQKRSCKLRTVQTECSNGIIDHHQGLGRSPADCGQILKMYELVVEEFHQNEVSGTLTQPHISY